jgi:hypothetical protein
VRLSAVQFGSLICSVAVALFFGHTEARAGYVVVRKSATVDPLTVCDKDDLAFDFANDRSSGTAGTSSRDSSQEEEFRNVPSHPLLIAHTTTSGGAGAPSPGSTSGNSVDAPAALYTTSLAHQQAGERIVAESVPRRPSHNPFVLYHPPRAR